MRPLALRQQELDLILAATRSVPVQWRSRFLDALADPLVDLDKVDGAAVQVATTAPSSKTELLPQLEIDIVAVEAAVRHAIQAAANTQQPAPK
jgi:hypothetical protein